MEIIFLAWRNTFPNQQYGHSLFFLFFGCSPFCFLDSKKLIWPILFNSVPYRILALPVRRVAQPYD